MAGINRGPGNDVGHDFREIAIAALGDFAGIEDGWLVGDCAINSCVFVSELGRGRS